MPWSAVGIGDMSYSRSEEIERARSRTRLEMARTRSRVALTKAAAIKVVAAAVLVCLLSTALLGVQGDESVVQTTASDTSFTRPVMVNDNKANVQAAPVISIVPGNELFVTWQDSRAGNEDIYVSKSLDDGATFSPNRRADDSIVSSKQIEPAVAVSANGTIYLTWQDNRWRTLDYDIFFSYSTDDGETFSPNIKVDDSTEDISWQERPSIAVTEDGLIYIAWTDDRTRPLRVRGCTSTDGGVTFSDSEEIVPSGASPSGQTGVSLIAAGDRILATFMDNMTGVPNPYICISDDGGRNFSAPVRLDGTGDSGVTQRGVTMTLLPDDGVMAAWEDQRNGNWDIYAVYVSADGTVSETDFRVDDDTTNAYQRNPGIASDQLGNVYAIWEDERDSSFAIRFAYLVAGERQFSASIEVATPGSDDMQRRPSICTTAPGHVFVSWQDDRAGSYDIYSSAGYVPELDLGIPEFSNLIVPIVGVLVIAAATASRRRREVG